jgi:hypothetical protein
VSKGVGERITRDAAAHRRLSLSGFQDKRTDGIGVRPE